VEDSVFIPASSPVIDSLNIQNVALCFGDETGEAIVYHSQNPANMEFIWSNGTTNDTLSNLAAGDYYVLVQDARPCKDSIAFTILQPAQLQFSAVATNVSCAQSNDGSIAFSVSGGTAPFVYVYNETNATDSTVSNVQPSSYAVFVQDNNGCSTDTLDVIITEPDALMVQFEVTPASGLASFDGMVQATISGGTQPYDIAWNDVNGQIEELVVYLNPGWVTATIVDANGCSLIDSVYVGMLATTALSENEFFVYPNPAHDQIMLPAGIESLAIFDAKGALVRRVKDPALTYLLQLSPGMYILELQKEDNIYKNKLIVK
jgi:hypothetical protein